MQCLQDIHTFSRIKNATVLAALRASGGNSESSSGSSGSGAPDATVKIIEGELMCVVRICTCLYFSSTTEVITNIQLCD